jgi:hypothetical protein
MLQAVQALSRFLIFNVVEGLPQKYLQSFFPATFAHLKFLTFPKAPSASYAHSHFFSLPPD